MYEAVCRHCSNITLEIERINLILHPGDIVKLSRFDYTRWRIQFGWYTWGGNRPMCGWYLIGADNPQLVKPLQLTDLEDIYLVEQ